MTAVYLEQGTHQIVASAVQWPSWCRFATTEAAALQALYHVAPRYQLIVHLAGLDFEPDAPAIVAWVRGNAITDLGAPAIIMLADLAQVDDPTARRGVAPLRAAWSMLDKVIASAPCQLRKDPQGGGRERDQIVEHVINAERAYARQMGVRRKRFAITDQRARSALRAKIFEVLSQPCDGSALIPEG